MKFISLITLKPTKLQGFYRHKSYYDLNTPVFLLTVSSRHMQNYTMAASGKTKKFAAAARIGNMLPPLYNQKEEFSQ